MDTCLSKFEELKQRAEKLQYNDLNEQDDIMRKTSMYVTNCFENKEQLLKDLEEISFYPLYPIANPLSGYNERAWEQGRQELVNFLDTRIEELKLKNEIIRNAKADTIVNHSGMSPITGGKIIGNDSKYQHGVNWSWVVPTLIVLFGGSFWFGFYVGTTRFDSEKNQLYNENIMLKEQIDSFRQTK
jgi:hypothetical protein